MDRRAFIVSASLTIAGSRGGYCRANEDGVCVPALRVSERREGV
jgi:hypothetical protein